MKGRDNVGLGTMGISFLEGQLHRTMKWGTIVLGTMEKNNGGEDNGNEDNGNKACIVLTRPCDCGKGLSNHFKVNPYLSR